MPNKFHTVLYLCIARLVNEGCQEISEVEVENVASTKQIFLETLQDSNYFEFIGTMKELAIVGNYEAYYNTVRKFALLRELQDNGIDTTEFYNELEDEDIRRKFDTLTIQDILNQVEMKGTKLRGKYDVKYVRDEMWAGEDTAELIESFKEKPAFGAYLQSPYLTTLYQGWCRGHLLLRSAPSGVGKSRLAVADLCNVGAKFMWNEDAQDFIPNLNYQGPSFFIHTEMKTREEINPMFLACVSGVEYRKIRNGLIDDDEAARVIKAGEILLDSKCGKLIDMPDFTMRSIDRKIKELVENDGVTYGVFDYVQLQGALAAEYRAGTDVPAREDLVLKNAVTELKTMAERYNVGLMSMTQLNDEWKTKEFPDESCLSGAKSMVTKLDGGSIVVNVKDRLKELKRVEPFIKKRGFGSGQNLRPNMVEYIYKGRFSEYAGEKIKVWSYFNKGTFRRVDFFCTDSRDEFVPVPKTVMDNSFATKEEPNDETD